MADRFYVATLEGYLQVSANSYGAKGLTVTVHDRAYLHRAVALYRSEDHAGSRPGHKGFVSNAETRRMARLFGEAKCARLNAKYPEGFPA